MPQNAKDVQIEIELTRQAFVQRNQGASLETILASAEQHLGRKLTEREDWVIRDVIGKLEKSKADRAVAAQNPEKIIAATEQRMGRKMTDEERREAYRRLRRVPPEGASAVKAPNAGDTKK